MANNGQVADSARAVQYLNQEEVAPKIVQRPRFDVPVDVSYNLERFLNPQLHAEDRHLRPPQSPTPLTEQESRARMTDIINSLALDMTPKHK
ncbi:hypothetical protein AAE478_005774 [Parahypoxylon ruwenzoriense]